MATRRRPNGSRKGCLPFTVSALYNGKRLKECLTGYNPLLILDLDGLSAAEIERLRALIEAALYTVACFLSPGGAGLKAIVYAAVRIEPVPENHRVIYDTMKAWYETLLDVGIDASGSDAGRLCFVSDDSGLFISPRFSDWLNDTGQLAATVTTDRPDYWLMCLRKWLVATVACAVSEKQENHSVLLLSDAQGIGKTTWCRHLVPPSLLGYVYSGNIDPSSKDAPLLLSDCFLIILDELSGQSRMELNRLKAMITKDSVYERRSYARNAETYTRRASFLATVNDRQVLTDRTGSRRFLCFEAQGIDYATPVDHAGIYSQALALYRSGFKFWFSGTEITEINLNNEAFQQSSPEEELFYTYFRKPVRFEAPSYLSSSEILAKLALFTRLSITSMNVINLGKY
ncbi:MAG: DUF5906 domain-containing protein [Parabacteroides sp.]|nr:DUF5906 domain-containing protein [Parabacteroides sp.]